MCPFFRLSPQEEASPRAKANLVRHCLTDTLPVHTLSSPELKRISDLCFNCKQCQLECPANVDIPHLMIEAKAQYLAQHGLTRSQWFISRVPNWTPWLTRLAPLINMLQRSPIARWALERLWGVARRRKLPAWARRTFLHSAPADWLERPPTANGCTVAYFVDHYANAHDPEIALAFGRILQHHDYWVHVPPRQLPSGMDLISLGDLESARALAEHNVRTFVDLAREGCPIVCTEPTAAVCLKFEYPALLGTSEAALVASRVVEAGAFLSELHGRGRLRTDFQPVGLTAAYHTPCHLKALGPHEPLRELCDLIPELEAPRIDEGCSGMAGAFGLSARDFEVSLQIGRGLCTAMQAPNVQIGLSECSSCRLQMEQTVDKPALHPLKLLAWSYGLMPELSRQLRKARRTPAR
jgi:Fe-S oxidoreductase